MHAIAIISPIYETKIAHNYRTISDKIGQCGTKYWKVI